LRRIGSTRPSSAIRSIGCCRNTHSFGRTMRRAAGGSPAPVAL
jgi:hypothetical protein